MTPMRTGSCSVLPLAAAMFVAPDARAQDAPKPYAQIPSDAFAIIAEARAKPGKEDELRNAALPLIALVRSDPKNLVYFLQEDRNAPGRLIFYEVFATEADFEAHNAMPYVQEFLAKLPDLATGDVQVTKMRVLQQSAP